MVMEAKDKETKEQLERFSLKLDVGQADKIAENIDYLVSKIHITKDKEICADYFSYLPFREMKEFKERMAHQKRQTS